VNDTLGHDVGDQVLIAAAHALRDTIRAYDEVCRAGGEEFVIVAPAIERVGTTSLVDRFREAVADACAPILPDGWRQTASFGAALHPAHGRTKDELLKSADEALYEAKRTGRDRLVFASDDTPADP
jgi:diguanylate cyclase (GGDEF)-like protein